MHEDMKYWVWLSMMQKIKPGDKSRLLEHLGTPVKIWEAQKKELCSLPFANAVIYEQVLDESIRKKSRKVFEVVRRSRVNMVSIQDRCYPEGLKQIYDPPLVLYVKGKLISDEKMVAVVGSRKATGYGLEVARKLSYELVSSGITVISGMARGIDSAAHKGALEGGGRTVAVLGCGTDTVYPPENRRLMKQIEKNGAVISEYPPGTPPLPRNFVARNRIISGASMGTVVVEAGERSGSLITAGYALEQGRDVFAVPGNIDSEVSRGTNKLIKDGAKVVASVNDILEEVNSMHYGTREAGAIYSSDRDDIQDIVMDVLKNGPKHTETLAFESGIDRNKLENVLILMELNGIVDRKKGMIFKSAVKQ